MGQPPVPELNLGSPKDTNGPLPLLQIAGGTPPPGTVFYLQALLTSGYLAQAIKEHVEVGDNGAPGHLHNVVQGLTGIIAQPAVNISKARQDRLDELLQVQTRILATEPQWRPSGLA